MNSPKFYPIFSCPYMCFSLDIGSCSLWVGSLCFDMFDIYALTSIGGHSMKFDSLVWSRSMPSLIWVKKAWIKLLHFEWSPPWHHIDTYLSQILTFFVLKSGEDEKERIILMKSRGLRPLEFIRIILSSSSLLLVRDPAVTTVIYLIQTDSRYAWFQRISDARASRDA